jgi:membrane protease YdiL (CAAX protease family)
MRTALKLVLIYFGIQLLSAFVVMVSAVVYNIAQGRPMDAVSDHTVAFTLFLGFILMGTYLWIGGYIRTDKRSWSAVSPLYLAFTTLACLTSILILEYIQSLIVLPNLLESSFNTLQSGWLGILSLAVFGPVLEELMFRGAITSALLKEYNPAKAIVLSALVFGIFHINPAQVLTATLVGLLLGWVYYQTASLIPCILIHVLNNATSVYINLKYPRIEYLQELFSGNTYFIVLIASVILFALSIFWMRRIKTL